MTDIAKTRTKMHDQARLKKFKIDEVAEKLHNGAVKLEREGKDEAAFICQRRALNMFPESSLLWNGLGAIQWNCGRFDDAYESLRKALDLESENHWAHGNMSKLMMSTGDMKLARFYYESAKRLSPPDQHAALDWNFAMGLLAHGSYKEGFDLYEQRFEVKGRNYYPNYGKPMWRGEPLDGKTIFIQAEQGIGDRILFSRYVFFLKVKYPTVKIYWMISSADLVPLENLMFEFHHAVQFIFEGMPFPEDVDYYVHMMSLARLSGTSLENIPPDPGFIRARCSRDAGQVTLPLPHKRGALKVGIAWTGNPAMLRNNARSIPLAMLLELEEIPEVQLYGLQFGRREEIEKFGADEIMCDVTTGLDGRGIVGTGCVMMNLDLVITVCTATAHLAGALGVPTWVLLCADPYWVWLRDRPDSPWYPSVRLIRQTKMNDWRSVIDQVKIDLTVKARQPREKAA